MNEILNKLIANGLDAYQLTLQWIACRDGSRVLAYSTYRPQVKANFFGNDAVNATCSIVDTSQPKVNSASSKLLTVWLNDAGSVEEELYRSEYGDVVIGVVVNGSIELHTASSATNLLPADVSASAQPTL